MHRKVQLLFTLVPALILAALLAAALAQTEPQAAKKAAEEHKVAIQNILSKTGMEIRYLEREEYGKFLKSQDDYWSKTIKAMDLKL